MLSNSRIDELVRYTKGRFPARLYLPLALFLCLASMRAGWPATAFDFAINVLLAGTLLFQFRLWDDLSDVTRDALSHPDRVLPQAASRTHFRILLGGVFTFNLAMLTALKPATLLVVFLLLNTTIFIWYRYLSKVCPSAVVSYHVVLIKYPVFMYLLSHGFTNINALLYAAALVYLCFCVHEVLHDTRLRAARGSSGFLAFEMASLAAVATLMVVDLGELGHPAAAVQASLTVLGTAGLLFLLKRHRAQLLPGRWPYAVFFIGFSWLLNYSLVATSGGSRLVLRVAEFARIQMER